jgi:putative ABC transport system ATP-binding protein
VNETGQQQIRIKDVAKLYGDHNVQALSGISLDIAQGEFIALMGASGCGKSTLLNIMGGIDRASSGSVLVNGDDLAKMNDDQLTRVRASKIGFIFQFFNLLSTLTVRENVALPLELLGKGKAVDIKKRVDQMLERVNIAQRGDFYPAHLSGGELQRTAIARALIHSPQLILADEPTGNLDTENGIAILELLTTINKEDGLTIVMATHSPEAAAYGHRMLRMKDGLFIEDTEQCPVT